MRILKCRSTCQSHNKRIESFFPNPQKNFGGLTFYFRYLYFEGQDSEYVGTSDYFHHFFTLEIDHIFSGNQFGTYIAESGLSLRHTKKSKCNFPVLYNLCSAILAGTQCVSLLQGAVPLSFSNLGNFFS